MSLVDAAILCKIHNHVSLKNLFIFHTQVVPGTEERLVVCVSIKSRASIILMFWFRGKHAQGKSLKKNFFSAFLHSQTAP